MNDTHPALAGVRELMARQGLSQGEVARRLGVTRQSVQQMLRGARPRIETLERLAAALGYGLEITFRRLPDPPRQ